MRLLVAVKSCVAHRDAGYHDTIMNTWGKDVPADVDLRFFVGGNNGDRQTVGLTCPDDYMSLPLKTRSILQWSLWREYSHVYLCDVDTFIIPSLLVRSGFDRYDFSGRFGAMPAIGTTFHYRDAHGDYPNCHPWASGGVGYFLSRSAAQLVARSEPNVWAEDMFVGQVLGPHIQNGEITAADLPIECESAWHFPRRKYNCAYDPKFKWMEEMYADHN